METFRKTLDIPLMEQRISSSEESSLSDNKDLSRNIEALAQENENFLQREQQQRMPSMNQPFQVLRLNNKPNFE